MHDAGISIVSEERTDRSAVSIYFAAGINVWRRGEMFRHAINELETRCRTAGMNRIRVNTFYPYGYVDDVPEPRRKRFSTQQAAAVFADMLKHAAATRGGRYLYDAIRGDYDSEGGGDIVLIGHSAGGVASYKAALLLEEAGYPVARVIMVGAPQLPIHKSFRDRVYALEYTGLLGDFVCRCGFHWFRRPRERVRLPLVNGHPFYFCPSHKDQDGVSNLSKVVDKIWGWF
jgi:hypothetical protein